MVQPTNQPMQPNYQQGYQSPPQPIDVVVRDVEMKFGSMVLFLIKWSLAAIPALFILAIVFSIVASIFGGMLR